MKTLTFRKLHVAAAILMMGAMTSSISQTLSDWAANGCAPYQAAQQASTAYNLGNVASNDPYLSGAANKSVSSANPYQKANGVNPGNFSCNGAVKGVFDQFMNGSSIFGVDLGTLFSGVANAEAGNLCGDVNKAIGSTFGGLNLNCPHVNIPGFNNGCHVGVSANANGVGLTTNGNVGGYSANGSSSTSTGTATMGGNAVGGNSTSSLGKVGSTISCWFSGGAGC